MLCSATESAPPAVKDVVEPELEEFESKADNDDETSESATTT